MNTSTLPAETLENFQLENSQLKAKLAWYEEPLRLQKHQQFSASSERFERQGVLFNEAETLAGEEPEEPEVQQVPAHERKKPVRKPLSKDLPRAVAEIDIADAEKQCDCCGGEFKAFGNETSCKLDVLPAQVKVLEVRRLKYACDCQATVKTAPVPKMPIPKSLSTPGLLAWIITSKYCGALPLYRQEFILKRMGAEISRTVVAEWMISVERSVKPFVIGRKNWMFAHSVNGANTSAVLYSLIETAKANGLESYTWFRYVLTRLPQLEKEACVEHLLPMNLVPDDIKMTGYFK